MEGLDDIANLASLLDPGDASTLRMDAALQDKAVSQIVINRHDRIFITEGSKTYMMEDVFASASHYVTWLRSLAKLTDLGEIDPMASEPFFVEGTFDPARTGLLGSIHLTSPSITLGEPALTVRKQPTSIISLEDMATDGMLSREMYQFLREIIKGRLNVLISGPSGAGKTTLIRALSRYIDPNQRVITVEEIGELHLSDRLPNVVPLISKAGSRKATSKDGTLLDLVEQTLRMRATRIWVGEVRGSEAFALTKACLTGHDGSLTSIHANSPEQAVRTLVSYISEAGVGTESSTRDQVQEAFQIVIQLGVGEMGRRLITNIAELQPARESENAPQRINPLFHYDRTQRRFVIDQPPSRHLKNLANRYGANLTAS